jgi:hypothetical protein
MSPRESFTRDNGGLMRCLEGALGGWLWLWLLDRRFACHLGESFALQLNTFALQSLLLIKTPMTLVSIMYLTHQFGRKPSISSHCNLEK